jgi:sporulation protein YlmC with PRC-barrel domain
MHVRFSTLLGWPIRQEDTGEVLGTLTGILLQPDTGVVEGFFVRVKEHFMAAQTLFLSSMDVRRLTNAFMVRGPFVLSPIEDVLRLQELLRDPRSILGQRIRTVSGINVGRCCDVQFDTLHFRIEWIFPKKFFREGLPISITDIVEVQPEAIIVRDPALPVKEKEKEKVDVKSILPTMPEAA